MSEVSAEILNNAIRQLKTQSHVPESPASLDRDDNVNLCLAALIAKAGIKVLNTTTKARLFERELARSGSKAKVVSTFTDLGWSSLLCRRLMKFNDELPNCARKRHIPCYLKACSAQG